MNGNVNENSNDNKNKNKNDSGSKNVKNKINIKAGKKKRNLSELDDSNDFMDSNSRPNKFVRLNNPNRNEQRKAAKRFDSSNNSNNSNGSSGSSGLSSEKNRNNLNNDSRSNRNRNDYDYDFDREIEAGLDLQASSNKMNNMNNMNNSSNMNMNNNNNSNNFGNWNGNNGNRNNSNSNMKNEQGNKFEENKDIGMQNDSFEIGSHDWENMDDSWIEQIDDPSIHVEQSNVNKSSNNNVYNNSNNNSNGNMNNSSNSNANNLSQNISSLSIVNPSDAQADAQAYSNGRNNSNNSNNSNYNNGSNSNASNCAKIENSYNNLNNNSNNGKSMINVKVGKQSGMNSNMKKNEHDMMVKMVTKLDEDRQIVVTMIGTCLHDAQMFKRYRDKRETRLGELIDLMEQYENVLNDANKYPQLIKHNEKLSNERATLDALVKRYTKDYNDDILFTMDLRDWYAFVVISLSFCFDNCSYKVARSESTNFVVLCCVLFCNIIT